MSWESIGSVGDGQMPEDRDWILFCCDLALLYVKFVCGDPPSGCELGVMWHEHELGEYPSLGVSSGEFEPPWDYINQCEAALERFGDAVSWSEIQPTPEDEDDEHEDFDNDARA